MFVCDLSQKRSDRPSNSFPQAQQIALFISYSPCNHPQLKITVDARGESFRYAAPSQFFVGSTPVLMDVV